MAIATQHVNWGRVVKQGIVAGIIGAILIDAFVYFTGFFPNHVPITALWQYVASSVGSNSPWLGLAMHLVVSIAWGIGFAYVASTRANITERPILSGFVFGCVVWVVMQFALMLAHVWAGITATSFASGIIAHTLFFGIPVALTVRGMSRGA
jgi:hypothetical protein